MLLSESITWVLMSKITMLLELAGECYCIDNALEMLMIKEDNANGAALIGSDVLYGVLEGRDINMPCDLRLQ